MCYSKYHFKVPEGFICFVLKLGREVPGVVPDLEWMREMLIILECPGCTPLIARLGSFTHTGSRGLMLLRGGRLCY